MCIRDRSERYWYNENYFHNHYTSYPDVYKRQTFASISATEEQSGMEPMTAVNFYVGTDIEAICYDKLKSTRRYFCLLYTS